MHDEIFSELVYSKNVIEFVTVANEYCSFIENAEHFSRKDFLSRIQKVFPLLYLKASLLPEPDMELSDEVPEKYVTEEDYNYIHDKLISKLGDADAYQEIYDSSLQYSYIPVEGSISENITDIYQDLKDFILSYRIGTIEVMNDAFIECRNNFEQYWGQKLVNALRAIHFLLYSNTNLEEEDQHPEKPANNKRNLES
jgi:hypothetical protein